MDFKHLIDLDSFESMQERYAYIEELKKESSLCSQSEQAIKLALNSIYGALANKWFHWINVDIAEAITLGGQHAIKSTETFIKNWVSVLHTKFDLLLKFGKKNIEPIDADNIKLVRYIDTDSQYITFNDIRNILEFEGTETDLILELNQDLQPHLNQCFKDYADEYNLKESFLDFELENISNKGIWLAKKKYILNLTYKDGITYDEPKKKFTGIEVIQRSTPKIARKLITDSIDWLIKKEDYNLKDSLEYMKLIRELKKEFKYCSLEDKCLSTSINDYKKFIIDDVNELIVAKGCPIHVRAAGHYNYLLHKSGLGNKYEKIGNGSKVKWYYTKDNGVYGVFGFVSGSFPEEFAPEIDLGAQFNRTILGPIDRIGSVTGLEPILNGGTIIRAGKVLDNVENNVENNVEKS